MNTYAALYKSKIIEVHAKSSYDAQKYAALVFKAKKTYDVSVYLTEIEGTPIEINLN